MTPHCSGCGGKLPDVARSYAATASKLCFGCYEGRLAGGRNGTTWRNCPACANFDARQLITPCDKHRELDRRT